MGLFSSSEENEDNKKTTLVLGLIAIMVIILGIVTYLFFYNQQGVAYENETPMDFANIAPTGDSNDMSAMDSLITDSQSIAESTPNAPVVDSTPESIAQTAPQVAPQPAQAKPIATTTPKAKSTIASLKYTIKPNNADIYECVNMRNGRWIMPKKCEEDILNAVQRLIDANNELIAIEVSGIVDGNPYSGPSAELKQEGLASFRAREGIISIMRGYSNVAAFEGPSQQARGKRGFQVKAYYLSK